MKLPLILALLASLSSPPAATGAREEEAIEIQKRGLAETEQQVHELEQDLGAHRGNREALLAELEQRERHIADLARAGHQLAAMISEQETAVSGLRERLALERAALDQERTALGGVFRSAYAMGRGDRIRMLLDQEDPNRLSRIMSYYGYLNRFRVERIEAIGQRSRTLEDLARAAEEEKARLSMLARSQEETRDRLSAAQSERIALLTALEQTIATQQDSVTGLRTAARDMRLLLEQLERQARELPEAKVSQESLKQLRGSLSWPLSGAPLESRYGSPKGDGNQSWDGVVLGADEGAEVRAVHHGRVAYADWLRGFGLLLIIEHDEGYMTLYGHNQTLLKESGEWVAAGDAIALSGNSGGRASPGLYFAIRYRGRPLNPETWCRGKNGLDQDAPTTMIPPMAGQGGISSLQSRGDPRAAGAHIAICAANFRSTLR